MYLTYNGCETAPMQPEFISDFNDYRVDQNRGSGYFFRDQIKTALLLNGKGLLPLG
jgi:hypothetical protein